MFHLTEPYFLGLLLIVPLVYAIGHLRRKSVKFSSLSLQANLGGSAIIAKLPGLFLYTGVICMAVAMARPVALLSVPQADREARDIALVVDISDSMEWGMVDPALADGLTEADKAVPSILTGKRPQNIVKRIDASEASIQSFLDKREGDRVALIFFDTKAYYGWPFSTDLKVVRKIASGMHSYVGSGTEFEAKNGPIQYALNHFKSFGQARSRVMVMITDGEAEISEKRFQELSEQLSAGDIHLYVIGIGYDDWSANPATEDLRNLTDSVKGSIIQVKDVAQLNGAFDEIDRLERSTVHMGSKEEFTDIAHWFAIAAIVCLFAFMSLGALVRDDL